MRNDTCNVIKWELDEGHYDLESIDIYEGRFVQVIVRSGSIEIEGVTVRAAENPDPYNLEFDCADEEVVTIINAAKNTLAQNGLDLFMDCPGRERSGWINDIFFTRRASEVLTGNYKIEKNSLENYALCEQNPSLPDGMIPMCYPADHFNGEFIPNCAMWYGINACEYCVKTGDEAFAAQIKDQIYAIIKYFEDFENEYGLIESLKSWVFVEWSEANSKPFVSGLNFPSNMMYQAMLEAVAKLYGDDKIAGKAARMRENIIKLSYNGEFFEDNLIREDGKLVSKSHISEACQYHAFYFGHADKNSHPELYELLKTTFTPDRDKATTYSNIDKANIITGLMMRLFIWLRDNERARAVKETKQIFGPMAALTSTLWENTGYHASCNHGCASYAAYVLVRAYTGFNGLVGGMPTFEDEYLGEDCSMKLPLEKGTLYLTVKNGVREWRVE
jgi:alpha-L-rhamnosidase